MLDYRDAAAEHEALRHSCGLVDLSWRDRLRLEGPDRQRFLHGYTTCEVRALQPGAGVFGFFTDPQGRILADAVIAALEERLLVLLPAGCGEPILRHLERFVLADRVEIATAPELVPLALVGPRAAGVLGAAAGPAPDGEWAVTGLRLAGGEVHVQRLRPLGEETLLLWTPQGGAGAAAEALVAAGARPVGMEALEVLRVESGVPRFGVEYDGRHFPQETGLEDGVSYTKGCYLGQEVVARIHYRGHVNRLLCRLVLEPPIPAVGEPLSLAGEEVGRVGAVVSSPQRGCTIGLAILHRKAAAPGTRLETAGGATAVVEGVG